MKNKFLAELIFSFETFSRRTKILVVVLLVIFVVSGLLVLEHLNQKLMVDRPIAGGSLTEGVLGSPRFINPLLAASDADRDLVELTYSGLLRLRADGNYEPDLAKSYDISSDGLIYTFKLRPNLRWSDGEPVKASDVVFTINSTQDPIIKSPKRASWNGVLVKKVDDQTIQFILKKPFFSFLDNATIGILPEHLWGKIKPEQFALSNLNVNPVGSGPYVVKNVAKDSFGIPLNYQLSSFKGFALGEPKISSLIIRFYGDEKALLTAYRQGEIESASAISSASAKKLAFEGRRVIKSNLPRTFAVFLNQSRNPVLVNKEVREALDEAAPRQAIIDQVLNGYGQTLNGVLPENLNNGAKLSYDLASAREILFKAGWSTTTSGTLEKQVVTKTTSKKGSKTITTTSKSGPAQTLSFSLATANIPELKAVATLVASNWTKLGARVNLEFFEPSDLNQDLIRPRKYETLLFGEVTGRNSDLYPFWHSSQRLDPGLNIAMYTNAKVDKWLEEIRATADGGNINSPQLADKYRSIAKEIASDHPAIFLYSPYFLYIVPNNLKGVSVPTITSSADRFARIHEWYFKTDRVWKIFTYF
ncbi:MAG: ABC transporter substrate-binding protein [Candidatus Paceibacterota bacterium]